MAVLTLSEIKAHLRIEANETAEDALLNQINEAAQDYAEQYIGRPIPWTDEAGDTVTPPASIVAAIKLIAADLYENRQQRVIGASIGEIPTAQNMLHFYRINMGI